MKIKSNNTHKNIALAAVVVVILLCAAVGAYMALSLNHTSTRTSDPTRSQSDIDQAKKLESDPSNKTTGNNSDTPTPPTTDGVSGKTILQMVASSDSSNGMLYIRGGINNSVETQGSCFAILTSPDDTQKRYDTTLLQNSTTTDCKTISIPLTELSSGRWSFTLNYESDSKEGSTDEITFDV